MFYCERCNTLSKPGQSSHKLVTQRRDRVYYGGKSGQEIVGYGWEIAKEINVGTCCLQERNEDNEQVPN